VPDDNRRIVLLNTLVSRSTTRAKAHAPPTIPALDLFRLLERRRTKRVAIEFYRADDDVDDAERIVLGRGHDFIRLRHLRIEEDGAEFCDVILLIEFVDWSRRSFPVVDTNTYDGREIEGEESERGGTTAHVVARLPKEGRLDLGSYRCAIEVVHPISRADIQYLLCRQLRRHSKAEEWAFPVTVVDRKSGRETTKEYRYTPLLEFMSDVGRRLNVATEERELSLMVFTKRHERHSTAQPSAIVHEDFLADVEYRVGANQAPADPEEKKSWLEGIKSDFELRGFKTRLFYKHPNGAVISGEVHQAVAGAADLLMCPREHISLARLPKTWVSTINSEVVTKMRALLDRDELWEHSQ